MDIVEYISGYVKLKRSGNTYKGLCPFHNEKHPSFVVFPDEPGDDGHYYCFGCHKFGRLIDFTMEYFKLDYKEALQKLIDEEIVEDKRTYSKKDEEKFKKRKRMFDLLREAGNYYYSNLRNSTNEARDYLKNTRQLSEKVLKEFAIGYSNKSGNGLYYYLKDKDFKDNEILESGLVVDNNGDYYERFYGRVIFPILDNVDNLIGFGGRALDNRGAKYINSPENELFKKRNNLYGLNFAKRSSRDEFILVEGYMDVISLHEAGFDNAIASLGTALTEEQAELMKKYKNNVVVLYDSDDAGNLATLKAITILNQVGMNVKVLKVKDAKDPDEFIKKFGKDIFEELLESSLGYIEYEMEYFKNKNNNLKDIANQKNFLSDILKRIEQISELFDAEKYIHLVADTLNTSVSLIKKTIKDKNLTLQFDIDLISENTKTNTLNSNNDSSEEYDNSDFKDDYTSNMNKRTIEEMREEIGKPNAWKPWTKDEDEELKHEVEIGLTISEISKIHFRTYGAIRARIERVCMADNKINKTYSKKTININIDGVINEFLKVFNWKKIDLDCALIEKLKKSNHKNKKYYSLSDDEKIELFYEFFDINDSIIDIYNDKNKNNKIETIFHLKAISHFYADTIVIDDNRYYINDVIDSIVYEYALNTGEIIDDYNKTLDNLNKNLIKYKKFKKLQKTYALLTDFEKNKMNELLEWRTYMAYSLKTKEDKICSYSDLYDITIDYTLFGPNDLFEKMTIFNEFGDDIFDILRGVKKIKVAKVPSSYDSKGRKNKYSFNGAKEDLTEEEKEKYEDLVKWSNALAKDKGIPRYVIFDNKTLLNIATAKVDKIEDLLDISGIANVKYEMYANMLFNIIKN